MALNPGDTLLNGQYRVQRQLGRGGFGFVYLAQDTLLGEEVAVKELIPALVGDAAMLKRFLAEAKATMRLTHKRIVRTHNVFSEGGNYYIVMEYMPGGSLEDRLRAGSALAVEEAVRVAADVCEGLACAHEEGVVHCDLKPANILFDAGGGAKVADFGIAHVSEEMLSRTWMTSAGFVAGTLPYMSPEQADGVRDDPRVDVYAVGAVLYRTLTGRTYLEFDQRETPVAQARNVTRIQDEQPLPPSAHNRRAPRWLDGAVLKALAKQPERRYAGAGEMRAALLREEQAAAAAVPGETVLAPPRPEPAPSLGREKRPLPALFWPLLGGAAAVLVVVAIAILLAFGGGGGQATPSPTVAALVTAMGALPSQPATPEPLLTEPSRATPTPRPTDTPVPTDTRPPPTDTPTDTLRPPTATPTPAEPSAGEVRTRGSDGMQMVYVPAGEFLMGSTDADSDAGSDEKPQHTVSLDAFWIDRTEVTNAQYRGCVEAGNCEAPLTCDWGEPTYDDAARAGHPVVCVDWDGADAYCGWAGARLPTEAEWEKAARGSDGRVYPWGDKFDCEKGNFDDETEVDDYVVPGGEGCDGYVKTAPAGSFPAGASPYGALDMAGNVWEWVNDWYDSSYYDPSPSENPGGPSSGDSRVLRGGSWFIIHDWARSANRGGDVPHYRTAPMGFGAVCRPRLLHRFCVL